MPDLPLPPLVIGYLNHRKELELRAIKPHHVFFGSTQWHPEPQWLLEAWDEDKQAIRTFAMKDFIQADFLKDA